MTKKHLIRGAFFFCLSIRFVIKYKKTKGVCVMFGWKRKEAQPPAFPPEDFEPVIRASICTGEKVACMRNRHTGQLRELMLIRRPEDLDAFCRQYQLDREKIKTVY